MRTRQFEIEVSEHGKIIETFFASFPMLFLAIDWCKLTSNCNGHKLFKVKCEVQS